MKVAKWGGVGGDSFHVSEVEQKESPSFINIFTAKQQNIYKCFV